MTASPGVVVARKQRKPAVMARTVRRAAIPAPWPLETATERDAGTVVLVAGSAGTGKTTLLAWWADELGARGDAVGWASLDREDDDPAVLAQSVVGAVQAGLGAEPGAELRTTGGGAPIEPRVLVDGIVGGVAADPRHVWLLLDDAHVVRSAGGRALLDRLIRWAPANLHLVLASRSEPDLHLAKLRLEERLVEVREPQLRFSLEETDALLGLHGLDLDAANVDRLHQLTEGWPAGLGLAAVSLAHGRDTETFLREFAHNDRAISSYLVEEVLSTLDPEVREFLVTTSVLERVDPDAATAITGRQDARAVLLELSADSAMVTADPSGDAAAEAFRYHSLLRSHLSALLASRGPGQQRRAHRAAARWCLEAGLPRQALHHAREAGDDALASEVIRGQALHLLTEGQADEVSRTVAGLATDDPLLTGLGALALGELSDPQATREALDRLIEREPSAEPHGTAALEGVAGGGAPPLRDVMRLGGRMLALISSSPGAQDDPARTAGASAARGTRRSPGSRQRRGPAGPARFQGNGRIPPTDPLSHHALDLWLLAGLTDGGELLAAGWFEEASQAFHDVLDTARLTGHSLVALQAMSGLASVCAGAEDLRGMDLWSGRALRAAEGTPWQRSPRLLPAFVLGAWAAYGRMDDEDAHRRNQAARAVLAESASTLDRGPGPDEGSPRQRGIAQLARLSNLLDAHLTLAGDRSPSSSYAVARGVLTEVRAIAAQSLTGRMAINEVVSIHELLLRAGCARMAPEVESLGVRLGIGSERLGVMTALRLLHEGDDEAARELVHAFLSKPGPTLSWRDVVKAQLMAAVLAHRRGQPWRAQELLVAAMERAAPERAVRLMVDTVPGVPDLLVAGAGRFGLLEPFASELLTHVADVHPLPADRREGRLTTRELSLLRELPSLLTVKEIAAARSVSANTVKTQLRSIFDKLSVSSRREAVAAGRRLGLI